MDLKAQCRPTDRARYRRRRRRCWWQRAAGVDLVRLVRCGLPVGAVQFVLDSGSLTPAELDRIVLPRKTLANRRKLGTLTPEQSDRLVRVARLIAAAVDLPLPFQLAPLALQ